jgi:DNA-binding response OmpR family regulator
MIPNERTTLLLVDDDQNNLEILRYYLEEAGYHCVTARQGTEALALLHNNPEKFQAVLLDRMMPEMDGMECLGKIKSHQEFFKLPVIMQTAAASPHEIREGIDAGSFYYLTKPFTEEVLLAVVQSALRDIRRFEDLQREVDQSSDIFAHLQSAVFHIQTLEQANALAINLAKAFPNPYTVAPGLVDLLVNAIEHGNLNISFEEKTRIAQSGDWEAHVTQRLTQPEYSKKHVTIQFQKFPETVEVTIQDEGEGFDWQQYLDRGMDLACTSHGRGIAMAKAVSFDTLEYFGTGNVVKVTATAESLPNQTIGESLAPLSCA